MVDIMGCFNIRVQPKKCIFMRSPKSVDVDSVTEDFASVRVIDDQGRHATVVRTDPTSVGTTTRSRRFETSQRFRRNPQWGMVHDDDVDRTVKIIPNKEWIETHVDTSWLVGQTVLLAKMHKDNKTVVKSVSTGTITSIDNKVAVITSKTANGNSTTARRNVKVALQLHSRHLNSTVKLTVMNADGVVCTKECTGVLPWYNDKGKTDEEKGATRYLGVYLSFAGWQVQQEKLYKMAKSFYLETAWAKPSFRQMHALVQSLLVSRASYARHVMPVDNDITNY